MTRLDSHKDVLKWSSEEIIIPYKSPMDNKMHRYFPDFYVMKKNHSDGKIVECLIEVKPLAQCSPPKPMKGKPTKRYLTEVHTWGVNEAKWKAAQSYCHAKGYEWMIMTERDLGLNF